MSVAGDRVVLPEVNESFGQGLLFDRAVRVAGVAGEDELVVIALGGEDAGHVFVGHDPVVHVVVHEVGEVEVAVTDFHPEADGFDGRVRNEVFVELPGAVRSFGVPGPLLVDVSAGVSEDAVVEFGVIPGHDEGAGSAGGAAHGGAAVGVLGEFHVVLLFYEWEDFVFDELGVAAGHGVVFESAFAALGVAATVAHGDGDHHGDAVFGDQIIEGGEEVLVGAVGADDEGSLRAGDILLGDVDGNVARVGSGVTGGDDEFGVVVRIGRAEGVGFAGDAGIVFAAGGLHGEGVDGSVGDAVADGDFGGGIVGGTDDEVSVGVGRWKGAVGQVFGGDEAWGVGIAGEGYGALTVLRSGGRLDGRLSQGGERNCEREEDVVKHDDLNWCITESEAE